MFKKRCSPIPKKNGQKITECLLPKHGTKIGSIQALKVNSSKNGAYQKKYLHGKH